MLEVIGRRSGWLCNVLRKVLAWGNGRRWTGSSELRGTEGSGGGRLWRWCLCALVRMRWRGAKWNEEGLKEQRGALRECLSCCSVEGLAGEWRRGTVLSGGGDRTTMASRWLCVAQGNEEKTEACSKEDHCMIFTVMACTW